MNTAASAEGLGHPKLSVRDLCLSFRENGDRREILDHVNLTVQSGEFVCIVGPSGCGKSTLLHVLGGFLAPTSGSILIDGESVHGPDLRRIFVFQESGVFPWLTVGGNIGFGLSRLSSEERRQRVAHYVELVGLGGFEAAFPHQLSGGMKQRLEVARALAVNPDVLYMDEPFAALDFITRMEMRKEMLRIWEQERKTVLLVTHDIDEAVQLGDRVLVMSARPARVRCDLKTSMPHPRDVNSQDYINLRSRILDELGISKSI
jgi:ABC-type nitrate/sulfonate/bicarbonate transport system ATPase subunit